MPLSIDVRLIAATNVDLQAALRAKRFREDLYYRLRVSSLFLPPLRERPADILPLAEHFLTAYSEKLGRAPASLPESVKARLLSHSWPGNIRELENTIHHALVVCSGDELSSSDLELGTPLISSPEAALVAARPKPQEEKLSALFRVLEDLVAQRVPDLHAEVERALFAVAYRASGENQLETARLLSVSRNVVRARLIEHGKLSGPLRRSSVSTPASPARVLRVGYQKLGLMMLLKRSGLLDAALSRRGVSVDWTEYAGGIQLVGALKLDALDVAGVGDCPAVVAQSERIPIVYVAAEPPAPRGAALIVPADSLVQSVAALRGKRVVVNRAAQAHYLLMRALEEAGVERDAVEVCFDTPARAWSAFRAGRVDAWAIWDPFLSSARLELGARVLRDGTGLSSNSTYYVARRSFAEEHSDLLQELLTQLQNAARWARDEPEQAAELAAPGLGFSSAALLASWQRELDAVPVGARLLASQQAVADGLHRFELVDQRVSVADAAWHFELTG
jgi:aliphatic sulfonates family ABC transporter substrate-binding protein